MTGLFRFLRACVLVIVFWCLAFRICTAAIETAPKTLAKIRLWGKVSAWSEVALEIQDERLYALYWAQGEHGRADLTLMVASLRNEKVVESRRLGTLQLERSALITLGLHLSPNGTHLLCSSEVYQSPGKFKRLWVLDVAHLAAVSQFDPREVTNEQYEVDGFTNDGKTVRIASNPVTAIKSITVWDLDATDLAKVVSKKIVVPDPPGFLGSRVGLAEFLWVRTRRGTLDEYDINSGQRVRSVKYEGQLGPVLLAPLQSSLLATGVQGVPGRTNWGAYLLLYTGESNSPIRSRVTSQCEFNDVRLSSDRRYATALCDGTMLNAVLDVYQTKKLEAVTFETDNLAILGTVPLNRRYDPASVALESSSEGIIEAIVDEPDRIRVVQVQARRAW